MNRPIYIIALLVCVVVGVLVQDFPPALVAIGFLSLAAAIVIAHRSARQELGTAQTLVVLFFFLGAIHTFAGYLLAGLTSDNTAISSRAEMFYARAMFINALGLLAGACGYSSKLQSRTSRAIPRVFLNVDEQGVVTLFRFLVFGGAALMFYSYSRLGLMDYLSDPSKWPFMRYVTSDLFGGTTQDEWVVSRAMDLLTVSLPFMMFQALKQRRFLDIFLSVSGFMALLLPLRRANLLTVGIGFLILLGIHRKALFTITRNVILATGAFYVVSQCLFLWTIFADEFSPRQVLSVSSTALPEMRDLGWILSLFGEERLNGTTFLQALVPIPSISSEWSSSHSLRAVTTRLIGMEDSGQTGGLRLTLMGEAFINFGYLGVVAIGYLWGIGVGWCERFLQAAREPRSGLVNFAAALFYIWACFWVYMAGTQAAAAVKMGLILLFFVCIGSRWWRRPLQPQPAVAHG